MGGGGFKQDGQGNTWKKLVTELALVLSDWKGTGP